jgi:hypothetical protein
VDCVGYAVVLIQLQPPSTQLAQCHVATAAAAAVLASRGGTTARAIACMYVCVCVPCRAAFCTGWCGKLPCACERKVLRKLCDLCHGLCICVCLLLVLASGSAGQQHILLSVGWLLASSTCLCSCPPLPFSLQAGSSSVAWRLWLVSSMSDTGTRILRGCIRCWTPSPAKRVRCISCFC